MSFWKVIGKIFKFAWKALNLIREIIMNIFFLIFILLFIGLWGLITEQENSSFIPQEGVLVLNIQGSIVDSPIYDDEFYKLRNKFSGENVDLTRENSLFTLTQKIHQATYDNNIQGIILELDNFTGTNLTSLQYIGKYLEEFRANDKAVYAIGSSYDQAQYYLASFADKIYLTPMGSVNVYGFSANSLYYKTLLDNLDVKVNVFRVGTYKSAVEPFLRDNMSEESRANTRRWLETMWNSYLEDTADNREMFANELVPEPTVMLSKLRQLSGDLTQYALNNNLVDEIVSTSEFGQEMDNLFSYSPRLSFYDYVLNTPEEVLNQNSEIAIVFVNGAITGGSNTESNAGSYTITGQLQSIRDNDHIKAVVVRIDSPGGSVDASEAIRSEIKAIRDTGTPVVVSMGSMAASGGYWIASESDYIVASPNTITGSIGIFGIIPTFEKTLDSVGIHTDGVSTSPLADLAFTKELNPLQNELMQLSIENGYQSFVNIVAKARGLTLDQVEKVAQGQVWIGTDAKSFNLVDQLGDFDDALNKAAELAHINEYRINWLKPEMNWFNTVFGNISASLPKSLAEMIYTQLPISKQLKQQTELWNNLTDSQNRYIYCLNCADVN
ncbi:signal peptide peptidase SppA [Zophobihabitans entericus]|uniref:Signal peptide peptidase SppA n=1 Tax=Zophobihabitans entericus TaxID=1635327 RepID=A0A6G9ICV1_9GAMM|nr:signal peptide peptidase SppA [Zophobihabitans entericus]QIQ21652.1 signal peptide peptidase SppA [Zophobihabitans entericus]